MPFVITVAVVFTALLLYVVYLANRRAVREEARADNLHRRNGRLR